MKYGLLMVLDVLFLATLAFAGADTSGGGHVLVYKDDTVVLADPFIRRQGIEGTFHCKPGERGDFSPALKDEIRHVGSILTRYGAAVMQYPKQRHVGDPDPIQDGLSKFVDENVFRDAIEYCFVKELPGGDTSVSVDLNASDAEVHAVGHTEGIVTWFKEDLLRRMNLRDQARLVVHERLHAIAGNVPHGPILAISDGLKLTTELLYAQEHGKRPVLSDEQMKVMTDFVQTIADLELSRGNLLYEDDKEVAKNFVVWRNGGGLVHKLSKVAPTAYIGAASIIPSGGVVYDGANVINTPVIDLPKSKAPAPYYENDDIDRGHQLVIGANAFLKNSFIGVTGYEQFVFVGTSSMILNSKILSGTFDEPKSYHHTENGVLYQRGISIGSKVYLGNTTLEWFKALFMRDGSWMSNVKLSSSGVYGYVFDLELASGASIVNLKQSGLDPFKPTKNVLDVFAYAFTKWGDAKYRAFLKVPVGKQLDFKNNYICYSSPMDYETKYGDYTWKKHSATFIGEKEIETPAALQSYCE